MGDRLGPIGNGVDTAAFVAGEGGATPAVRTPLRHIMEGEYNRGYGDGKAIGVALAGPEQRVVEAAINYCADPDGFAAVHLAKTVAALHAFREATKP